MKHSRPQAAAAPASDSIVIAGCSSTQDSLAMARWLFTELRDWPRTSWRFWITDASDCASVRAAMIDDPSEAPVWQDVIPVRMNAGHAVCKVMGGRSGLVILADESAAAAAMRGLAGLVSGLTCFPADDPIATPLRKSFASHGVSAGI